MTAVFHFRKVKVADDPSLTESTETAPETLEQLDQAEEERPATARLATSAAETARPAAPGEAGPSSAARPATSAGTARGRPSVPAAMAEPTESARPATPAGTAEPSPQAEHSGNPRRARQRVGAHPRPSSSAPSPLHSENREQLFCNAVAGELRKRTEEEKRRIKGEICRILYPAHGRGSEPPSHGRGGGGGHICAPPRLTRKLRNASTSGKKNSIGLNKL